MSGRGIRLARAGLVAFCIEVEEGRAWEKERRRGFNGFSHLPRSPGNLFRSCLHNSPSKKEYFFETTCLVKAHYQISSQIFWESEISNS